MVEVIKRDQRIPAIIVAIVSATRGHYAIRYLQCSYDMDGHLQRERVEVSTPDPFIDRWSIVSTYLRGPSKRPMHDYENGEQVQAFKYSASIGCNVWVDCVVDGISPSTVLVHGRKFAAGFKSTQLRVKHIKPLHKKARDAVMCWLLFGKRLVGGRDVALLIAKNYVWATRDYRCWDPQS